MGKKLAFTLSEMLITLGIIGVVASLMIQALQTVNPDKDKIMFLKTFRAIEIAVADIIRDGSKYDQNYYAQNNSDFSKDPLPNAKAVIDGTTYLAPGSLKQSNALCYFLAEQFNLVDGVTCSVSDGHNFQTTQGVCVERLYPFNGTYKDIIVDTRCDGKDEHKFNIRIYSDGHLQVPATGAGGVSNENQEKAKKWMKNQLTTR